MAGLQLPRTSPSTSAIRWCIHILTPPTLTGAQQFATIRSYTATTGKNGVNLYDALTQLTTGKPWHPTTT